VAGAGSALDPDAATNGPPEASWVTVGLKIGDRRRVVVETIGWSWIDRDPDVPVVVGPTGESPDPAARTVGWARTSAASGGAPSEIRIGLGPADGPATAGAPPAGPAAVVSGAGTEAADAVGVAEAGEPDGSGLARTVDPVEAGSAGDVAAAAVAADRAAKTRTNSASSARRGAERSALCGVEVTGSASWVVS
jgi:hypothetical protein